MAVENSGRLHDISLAIGALQAQHAGHTRQLDTVAEKIDDLHKGMIEHMQTEEQRLGAIERTLATAKGMGQGIMMTLSTLAGAFGALLAILARKLGFFQ